MTDLDVVAFAYRPIQNPSAWPIIRTLNNKEPIYLEIFDPIVPVTSNVSFESPAIVTPEHPEVDKISRKKKNTRSRTSSRLDDVAGILNELDFLKNVTRGHTFLGMASYTYDPKPNVIDFIEDLALAGIRFCYFSAAPELESKAYAERLGLEIDWNSCIILSPDDGSGPGYHAIHDMKARLPRGISTIRNHILEVDDVPLHVSLFAECRPDSTREMIQIFQEHGEVVLCIGSSLNDLNVECFALVILINLG